jgi:hypothetical protein
MNNEHKKRLKAFIEGFFITIAAFFIFEWGIETGKEEENKRIFDCFTHPQYSGFAWVDGSDYFTCSHTIKNGKVTYKHKKG